MKISELKKMIPDEIQNSEFRKNLINHIGGVKSCNLIASRSKENIENLAMISSVFHLGANPSLLGFVIRPDSVPRDTLKNIRETKYCTLNHVNSNIYRMAHQTSARYLPEDSEFEECGLTSEYAEDFMVPFVSESNIKIALECINEIKIEENSTYIIVCKILKIYLPEDVVDQSGKVNLELADTIGVSGLETYLKLETLAKLSYAKKGQKVKDI